MGGSATGRVSIGALPVKAPEKLPGRNYPRRKLWGKIRPIVVNQEDGCGVCGTDLHLKRRIVDHIVPERVLRRLRLFPHLRINLMVVCRKCHSRKTPVDPRLGRGDRVGWLAELRERGWPLDRLLAALVAYEL